MESAKGYDSPGDPWGSVKGNGWAKGNYYQHERKQNARHRNEAIPFSITSRYRGTDSKNKGSNHSSNWHIEKEQIITSIKFAYQPCK